MESSDDEGEHVVPKHEVVSTGLRCSTVHVVRIRPNCLRNDPDRAPIRRGEHVLILLLV